MSRRVGLPLAPYVTSDDGVLLKLQLPSGAGAVYVNPSDPGAALLAQADDDNAGGDDEFADDALNNAAGHATGYTTGYAATDAAGDYNAAAAAAFPGSRWQGAGVKLLGRRAASSLEPMTLRLLLGYALMDVKKTYLMTGMMEEALGIIR